MTQASMMIWFVILLLIPRSILVNSYVTTWIEPTTLLPITAYWRFFLSGALSVSLSHVVTVPFDVVKTKTQTVPQFAGMNPIDVTKRVLDEEGPSAFLQGIGPTVSGYFIQGSLKYGCYEYFKPIVRSFLLSEGIAIDKIYFYMIASFFAESIGSTVLSPFEAARIRMVSKPEFATGLQTCVKRMTKEEGLISLYLGLPAMLLKNVPYTVVQLSLFEALTSTTYSKLAEIGFSAEQAFSFHVPITAGSALVAAVAGVVASQPGDSLLSAINKGEDTKVQITNKIKAKKQEMTLVDSVKILGKIGKELGVKGLFEGIQARMIHVAFIVVIQLLAYDFIKEICGLPPTGYH